MKGKVKSGVAVVQHHSAPRKARVGRVGNSTLSSYDVISLLGRPLSAPKEMVSVFSLLELVEAGIPRMSVDSLSKYMGISKKDFSNSILHISPRTLERKKANEMLDTYTSSRVVEVARVMEHAYAVFEDEQKVKKWLNSPNKALNNKTPLELIEVPTGLGLVDDVLGRIEEGIYS